MADIAVLGIGLDTNKANQNALVFSQSLDKITKSSELATRSTGSVTKSIIAANLALEASKKAISLLSDQISKSVKIGADFEQTMAKVGAVSKASADDFRALERAALEMGEKTQFSASQAASALQFMSMAGLKAQESISALPNVLNLAAASGVELGESANIITNIMSSMGKKTADLANVNNILVETFTSTNTTLSGLANTISYTGGIAATTGVSLEELSAITGILGNVGIDASRAGTALRASMSRLIDPTKEAKDAMTALGVEVGQNLIKTLEDLSAKGATTKDIIQIFGQEAGASLAALDQGGGINAVKSLAQNLKNVGNVADEVAKKQMNTLQGKMLLLESAVESVRIAVFKVFTSDGEVKKGIESLGGSITKNSDEFVKMAGAVKKAGELVVALANDSLGAQKNISGLTDIVKVLSSAVMIGAASFEALGTQIGYSASRIYDFFSGNFSEAFGGIPDAVGEIEKDFDRLKKSLESLWSEGGGVALESATSKISLMADATTKAADASKTADTEIRKTAEAFFDLYKEVDNGTDKINENTSALYEQSSAIGTVTESYKKAVEEADKFFTARPGGTFSGSSLVGQTYSVVTASNSVKTSATPTTTQMSNTQNLLSQYQNLLDEFTAYQMKDLSAELQLKDAEERLKAIASELAGTATSDLEKQLDLTESYFTTMKQIDSLQSDIARQQQTALTEQKAAAQGLNAILGSVLSDYEDLQSGDLSQALPVDKLKALESQFLATSKAIDGINWDDITSVDTQLISQFQNVSKEFLNQAELVFKSSDNYQTIKTSVKSEFDDLAAKLTEAMADADPKTFTDNLASLKTALSGTALQTNVSTTATSGLSDKLSAFQVISGQAKDKTDLLTTSTTALTPAFADSEAKTSLFAQTLAKLESQFVNTDTSATDATTSAGNLSQAMAGTQSPLTTANQNFSTVASNTATTVDFIAKKFADLKTAIDSGATTVGGGSTAPITPTKTFLEYRQVGELWRAIYSDSSYETLNYIGSGWKNVVASGNRLSYKDSSGNPHLFVSGVRSYASGAWNVNKNQFAQLHQGEMVIRSDDAPAVRSYMKSSGMSGGYGIQSMSQGVNQDTRVVELLSELVDLMRNPVSPAVYLNTRKVSEELSRYSKVAS